MFFSVKGRRHPVQAIGSKKKKNVRLTMLAESSGLGLGYFGYVVYFGGLSEKRLRINITLMSEKNVM